MNKILTVVSLLLFGSHTFSQDSIDEPQNVVVDWKVGTSKMISQIDSAIITSHDSIFMATVAYGEINNISLLN